MNILLYSDLDTAKIPGFKKTCKTLKAGNFTQAEVRKFDDNLYCARLNQKDRLLFALHNYNGECYCLILEYIVNHAYEKSRFLRRGTAVDENKIPVASSIEKESPEPLAYLNTGSERFNLLDKIISFDEAQENIYRLPPPLVIIGSAGSGKTTLTLEKMKQASGDILYVSLSAFLVQNSRNLYYSHGYDNENQEVEFLSFREFLESLKVPSGKEINLGHFESWFQRHCGNTRLKDPHKLFEEFRGVLTGSVIEDGAGAAWLSRTEYLELGVKQSIFNEGERAQVYDLFERYLGFLKSEQLYDTNILSHDYLPLAKPRYDFIVVDEVQDITNIQLFLILKTLRTSGQFILCGDSNQIVHPNFFSWSKVKSLFFEQQNLTGHGEVIRVLQSNYRNSPIVTGIANRILKLKQARFGSIDKESNYLVESIGKERGRLQLLNNNDKVKKELNNKTAKSTQFAVLVMHPEQKSKASKWFKTPLVFSIQEAKGLEYENIILYNFISDEEQAFKEISRGVDAAALDSDSIQYARSKDKRDKSLEVYKFYINSLYVAITRAVNNLYLLEDSQKHPLVDLLNLQGFAGKLQLDKQGSSLDEWQKEAHRLELQGKQEQANDIRQRILQQKPVPWPVFDQKAFSKLLDEGFKGNKKKRNLAMEYALIYHHRPTLNALIKEGIRAASQNDSKALNALYHKHYLSYDLNNPGAVLRDTQSYGIDHSTIFNLTPLMVAARLGNAKLAEELIERGAHPEKTGNNGLNALQMALEVALYNEEFSKHKLPAIYALLEPDSLSVQAEGRLIKLDKRLMQLFILNLMFARFYRFLGEAASHYEAFSAKDLAKCVGILPDSVLPERRKRQSYISSILSGNEVDRDSPYNRKLFKRIRRGHYIINPLLKIRLNDEWVPVHDLLKLEDLDIIPGTIKSRKGMSQQDIKLLMQHFGYDDQCRLEALQSFRQSVESLMMEKAQERITRKEITISTGEMTGKKAPV